MTKTSSNGGQITGLLTRRVAKILPTQNGLEKLLQQKKIRLYLGIDPTGARLHLGHAIALKKLMEFAAAGHEVIFLFGTGTVLVGDPSQRETGRKLISQTEIDSNIRDWQRQAAKVVDFGKVKIRQNSEWLLKLDLKDMVRIAANISAVQLFKRESFQRRLNNGDTVWYHETMYPILQGYDSVAMDVDLEIGGTDQEFNMLIGRELQKKMNHKEKYVLTLPLLLGMDGQKMSTTANNCVWLDDGPEDMYGKLMSIRDDLIDQYIELCTDLTTADLEGVNGPRARKATMATAVVELYHGAQVAEQAAAAFDAQFTKGEIPVDVPEVKLDHREWDTVELLIETDLAASKSEARRLLEQGGVKLNSEVIKTDQIDVKAGDIIQVGKRKFVKVK